MVSLEQRNRFIEELQGEPSTNFAYCFVFGKPVELHDSSHITLRAAESVASNNKSTFKGVIEELSRRKVKPESDWVLDDLLLFVLLVGASKFKIGHELCNSILEGRQPKNTADRALQNSFHSISQKALAVEGKYSFVKLVFCELTGQLKLNSIAAKHVYEELTSLEFFDELDVFTKLLAYRAFDLLVIRGVKDSFESFDSILKALESRAEKMSVREWFSIAAALRPSAWVWIIGGFIAVASTVFGGGVWYGGSLNSPEPSTLISTPASPPDKTGSLGKQTP